MNTIALCFGNALIQRRTFARHATLRAPPGWSRFFDMASCEYRAYRTQSRRRRAFAHKTLNQKCFGCSPTTGARSNKFVAILSHATKLNRRPGRGVIAHSLRKARLA
jgi:hypothetical protein